MAYDHNIAIVIINNMAAKIDDEKNKTPGIFHKEKVNINYFAFGYNNSLKICDCKQFINIKNIFYS